MTGYTWQVEATTNRRFPFRVSIIEEERTVLALRTQDKWPGQKGNIFCVRETGPVDDGEQLTLLERVPIVYLNRHGKRVEIVLDRAQRKRCDFLFLKKQSQSGDTYEQIFFRTQTGVQSHRSRGKPYLYGSERLEVAVDSGERYPWRFPGADTSRIALTGGDYALVWQNRFVATVERKTFDNLLHDLYEIRILHKKLAELSTLPRPCVVIEAQYGDFSDPKRLGERISAGHVARLLGELQAMHPSVQFIYAGNRKLANAWTVRFFDAVMRSLKERGTTPEEVREQPQVVASTPVRLDLEVRTQILSDYAMRERGFATRELKDDLPDTPESLINRIVQQLKREGKIERVGRGSGSRWIARS